MIAECQCFSEAKAGDICGACMCAEEEHLWCTQLRLLCLWHTAPLVLWLFLPSPCSALSVSRWYLWWAGPRALIQVSSFYLCACTSSYVTECLGIISDCICSYRFFFFLFFFFLFFASPSGHMSISLQTGTCVWWSLDAFRHVWTFWGHPLNTVCVTFPGIQIWELSRLCVWLCPLALGWQKGLILADLHCIGNSKCPSGGCVSSLFHPCKLPYLPSQARNCSPGKDLSLSRSEGVVCPDRSEAAWIWLNY